MAASQQAKSQRSRKVKALLAGGVVLGVGAAVTLAAWTDQEWLQGVFGAGSFNIEGSIDGTTWDDHEEVGGAAELAFSLEADNLSPSDVVAAPFVLRLAEATTYDATVGLVSAAADGANAANLTYGIITVPDVASCTAEATGTEIVAAAGTPLGTVGTTTEFELTAGADAAAGAPVTLCFQVTAGDELTQGDPATATWQFVGTSVE